MPPDQAVVMLANQDISIIHITICLKDVIFISPYITIKIIIAGTP
jgi:hypothetical protein